MIIGVAGLGVTAIGLGTNENFGEMLDLGVTIQVHERVEIFVVDQKFVTLPVAGEHLVELALLFDCIIQMLRSRAVYKQNVILIVQRD